MIQEFVDIFMSRKSVLEEIYSKKHPDDYKEIVTNVINVLNPEGKSELPDSTNIVEIDHGDYQGTLIYVIPETGYSPDKYWYVRIYYGSCSGCDTLQAINMYDEDPPTLEQHAAYMMLSLHVVQRLKEMDEEAV